MSITTIELPGNREATVCWNIPERETSESPEESFSDAYQYAQQQLPHLNRQNYALEQRIVQQQMQNTDHPEVEHLENQLRTNVGKLARCSNTYAVETAQSIDISRATLAEAWDIRRPFLFFLASVARFSPNEVENMMGDTVQLLEEFTQTHSLPPVLTTAEYYFNNPPDKRITFSGTPSENIFIKVTHNAFPFLDKTAELMSNIHFDPTQIQEEAAAMNKSAEYLQKVYDLFGVFLKHPQWDGKMFFHGFRGFSRVLELNGVAYPSKSIATNEPSRTIDHLLGTSTQSPIYRDDTHARMHGYAMVGQNTDRLHQAVERTQNCTTIPHLIANVLGIPVELIENNRSSYEEQGKEKYRAQLDSYVAEHRGEILHTLNYQGLSQWCEAYVNVASANAQVGNRHRALVHNNITKQQERASIEGISSSPLRTGAENYGLGGLPIEEVYKLQELRNTHPVLYILKEVLKMS